MVRMAGQDSERVVGGGYPPRHDQSRRGFNRIAPHGCGRIVDVRDFIRGAGWMRIGFIRLGTGPATLLLFRSQAVKP